jgi:hypothetical protein
MHAIRTQFTLTQHHTASTLRRSHGIRGDLPPHAAGDGVSDNFLHMGDGHVPAASANNIVGKTPTTASSKKARESPNACNMSNMPWEEGAASLSTSGRGIVDLVRDMSVTLVHT